MRNLTESILTYALALLILVSVFTVYRNELSSFVSRSFKDLTTATEDISRR